MNLDAIGYMQTDNRGNMVCTHPEMFWTVMNHVIGCRGCGMILASTAAEEGK